MTTPFVTIGMADVAAELGITNPTGLTLGDARVRRLGFRPPTGVMNLTNCRNRSALDLLIFPFPAVVVAKGSGSGTFSRITINRDGALYFFSTGVLNFAGTFSSYTSDTDFGFQVANQFLATIDPTTSGRGWWYYVTGDATDLSGARGPNQVWRPFTEDVRLDSPLGVYVPVRGSVLFSRSPGGYVVNTLDYIVQNQLF